VEEVVFGFTYILGSPGTRELRRLLFEGLSRRGHLIRKPPAGALDKEALEDERWAVGVAWTVVIIATPAFCRSVRGRDLMRIRDGVRRNVITLWKRRPKPGESYPWSSNVHLDLPEQLDRESVDKLIEEVSNKISHLEEVYSTNGIRGPVGRPGPFAMLSYSRKQHELARLVRTRLKRESITLWDYGDAPRRQAHYQDELAAKIRDSRVVIILLTRGFSQRIASVNPSKPRISTSVVFGFGARTVHRLRMRTLPTASISDPGLGRGPCNNCPR
jgi:hypothetical protein